MLQRHMIRVSPPAAPAAQGVPRLPPLTDLPPAFRVPNPDTVPEQVDVHCEFERMEAIADSNTVIRVVLRDLRWPISPVKRAFEAAIVDVLDQFANESGE